MKKFILFFTFLYLSSYTEVFCQHYNVGGENIIKATYDSLERMQRPVNIGVVPRNEHKLYTIKVRNQEMFDNLPEELLSVLQNGHKNILVKIKKGTYYFKEGHLDLVRKNYPETDIIIEGKGVTIVPKGWKIKNGDIIPIDVSGESCFIDLKKRQNVSPWGDMVFADSLVEIIDIDTKLCRLKCTALGGLIVPEGSMAYLDLTRWCRCYQYKIHKIKDGYIEFYAPDLAKDNVFGTQHYNVNYDFVVAKSKPRIRLCNASAKEDVCVINGKVKLKKPLKAVYLGNAANFLTIENSNIRQFIIKGITFLGNKPNSNALIKIRNVVSSNIEFDHCKFVGQRGEIINEVYSKNLYFHDNYISDNYVWGINSNPTSSNTTIENNTFENNGLNLSYNRCVTCSGRDYYIANNTFKNFGYCAVSVGLWYGSEMKVPCNGIIENNELWYDKHYFDDAWRYTIMDGGAIYVWTQNDRSIIRYNYIHDYTGMSQNHGIYCDDGAHHFAIYGNVILNTPMGHTIGSRRVARTEKARNKSSYSVRNNIKNFIAYNIVDGTIQFVGYEDKPNGCLKGTNVRMMHDGQLLFSHNLGNEYKGLEVEEMDTEYEYVSHNENSIVLKENGNKVLRGLPVFDKIDKLVKLK